MNVLTYLIQVSWSPRQSELTSRSLNHIILIGTKMPTFLTNLHPLMAAVYSVYIQPLLHTLFVYTNVRFVTTSLFYTNMFIYFLFIFHLLYTCSIYIY